MKRVSSPPSFYTILVSYVLFRFSWKITKSRRTTTLMATTGPLLSAMAAALVHLRMISCAQQMRLTSLSVVCTQQSILVLWQALTVTR